MGFWGVTVDQTADEHIDHFVPPRRAWWGCAGDGASGCRLASASFNGHRNAHVPRPSVNAGSVLGSVPSRVNP
jgi:hypothetical protein